MLLLEGVSQDEIAASLSCSKRTVSQCAKVLRENSITEEVLSKLTDEEVEREFFPKKAREESTYLEPDWEHAASELSRSGVTRGLLWNEYLHTSTNGDLKHFGYSAYCGKLDEYVRATKATMRIVHVAGKLQFVDWAGDVMRVTCPVSGQMTKAYLFVACLPYSDILFVEAFPNLKQDSWNAAHIHSFEYFGGVASLLVPDRCATAVDRAPKYFTKLNESYTELAEYYNTAILPARSAHPTDKALVEGGVRIAETWVIAKLRNEVFHSFAELNEAIAAEVEDINARPFQVREGSRASQFEAEEKDKLKPLPVHPFETSEWRQAKLAPDYHVQADYMRYSAPAKFIGKTFDVRLTNTAVTLYIDGAVIAKHARLYGRKGQYSTDTSHMPEAHRRFSGAWTPLYFQRWAGSVGHACRSLIDGVLASKAIQEQAFVPCANILGLSKRGKRDILEAACAQVNELGGVASYTRVKQAMSSIDQSRKRIDRPQAAVAEDLLGEEGRTRGASYYARKVR
jgi:transposase